MATAKQIAANRRNAEKSTGPKTDEGKANSRRNAVRHGLTGEGICLPEDMAREVEARGRGFAAQLRPAGPIEAALVRDAALASVRSRRVAAAAEAHTASRVRHAVRDWDDARDAEVRRLADLLASDPAEAVRLLERTAEGCDYLPTRGMR